MEAVISVMSVMSTLSMVSMGDAGRSLDKLSLARVINANTAANVAAARTTTGWWLKPIRPK